MARSGFGRHFSNYAGNGYESEISGVRNPGRRLLQ